MTPLCRHILPAGHRCTQPAVKANKSGSAGSSSPAGSTSTAGTTSTMYCRHHQVVKITLAKVAPKPDPYGLHQPLAFVFSEDRSALQLNFTTVIAALNNRQISVPMANAFNRLLRSCETNLRRGPLHEPMPSQTASRSQDEESRPLRRNPNEAWLVDDDEESAPRPDHGAMVRSVILTPQGDEIAPVCEIREDGETESHGQECPCRPCAEQFRNAPREQHHPDCGCGQCEHAAPGNPPTEPDPQQETGSNNPAHEEPAADDPLFLEALSSRRKEIEKYEAKMAARFEAGRHDTTRTD
ncbi:MAG TPA: hypothetical protein VFW25_08125 [Silvibacterium sp.]|nr:hypothetical protein [Silvibacterium sp.]